jgi:hypothetical protein
MALRDYVGLFLIIIIGFPMLLIWVDSPSRACRRYVESQNSARERQTEQENRRAFFWKDV